MKNKTENTEDKIAGLIQFLGDITIKSTSKHETETAQSGIDSLIKVASKFLELKSKNDEIYKVEPKPPFFKTKLKNQYISYVLDEFEKIFVEGLKQKDSVVNRHLIFELYRILDETMKGIDNWAILEELVDTRNVLGSTYTNLLKHSLENAASLESNLLTHHLVDIPQGVVFGGKYQPEYVTAFTNYHIYRMTKLIIEHDSFQAFTIEMDHFFNALSFRDPVETAGRISSNIYTLGMSDLSETIMKKTEELAFDVEPNCFKDFKLVTELSKKVEEFKKTLSESATRRIDIESIQQRIDRIQEQIMEFYISLLVYGVFFKMGALIISKGPSYARYMEELWYHGRPKTETGGVILNSTPISESIDWLTLYTMYSGEGPNSMSDFYMFEAFPDAESYHYQYYALMMIRLGKTFSFNMGKIDKIKSQRESVQFQFYYELSIIMNVDRFIDAVKTIENNPELLSVIRRDPKETTKIIENIKEQLKKLKADQNTVRNILAEHGAIDLNKIYEVKKQLTDKYLKGSIADVVSRPKYDESLENPNLIKLESIVGVTREFFVEQTIVSKFLIDPAVSDLATKEMNEIFKAIQLKIKPTHQDTVDFAEQIKSNVKLLKNSGKNPDVLFVPLDVEMELMKSGLIDYSFKRKVKIDDVSLSIINSWKAFDFTDILIVDSNCLTITYKAETKEKRIGIQESNTEEGKEQVLFTCRTAFLVEITDPQGFKRIVNQNVAALKADKSTLPLNLKLSELIKAGSVGEFNKIRAEDNYKTPLEFVRIDLTGVNLKGINLQEVDLHNANLSKANLSESNLSNANLSGSNLNSANLKGANLRGSDLYVANLSDANLTNADISDANIDGTNFAGAITTDCIGFNKQTSKKPE